ncbi:hypothetical protein SELR_03120 [Selenomonas ruminantium subsp. lactilytica TAM6421]|uniref:DUF5780 domain-containing protein n=1 Tax=Selenomonas ruminantium subsp. lactilytica (strain NBRC 103574 / TAM6421) TaxID=927704 RepID=I0GMN3_SELRL|nr:DUF5780 domain-containing protein [Selenomonas ruminantium]BAL82020.1 hypothetical protein SELR_03120 [Selenomonas ruminantium subsp. lactilytica TAM6421]
MKKISTAIVGLSVATMLFTSGCGNDAELKKIQDENVELKRQVESLSKENEEMKNKVAMFVPKENKANPQSKQQGDQPVALGNIEIGPDAGGASVKVSLKNVSPKTVDAIEFVVLQFDNFGKPSNRFNDESYGNVTSVLTVQGTAANGQSLSGGWTLFNMEKSRKAKVVVKQVHFTDGAVWENKSFDDEVARERTSY